MKVFAISKDGMFYKIGDDPKLAEWFSKTPAVESFLSGIQKGDSVDIKSEKKNGRNILSYITKTASGSVVVAPDKGTSTGTGYKPSGYSSHKSPEESEKIKRLSILSSVCTAVTALTGQLDQNSLVECINTLYDKLYAKVSQ